MESKKLILDSIEHYEPDILWPQLLALSSQPFVSGTFDGRIASVNQAFADLVGYSMEELVHMAWRDLTPAHLYEYEKNVISKLVANGTPLRLEKEYIHKTGRRIPVEVLLHVLYDRDQSPLLAYAFVTDITERKKQQAELERHRNHLETLVEERTAIAKNVIAGITDCFFALDRNWRFVFINSEAADIFGKTKDEILGAYVWDVLKQGDSFHEHFTITMFERKPTQFEAQSPLTGNWYELRVYPCKTGISVYFRDITKKKQTEIKLLQSKLQYKTLVKHLPDIVVRLDTSLKLIYVSPAIKQLGFSAKKLLGKALEELDIPHDIVAEWKLAQEKATATRNPLAIHTKYNTLSECIYFLTHIVPEYDERGNHASTLLISRDITPVIDSREAFRRQARLLNLVPEAIITRDLRDVITYWNDGAANLYELPKEKAIGKVIYDLLPTQFPNGLNHSLVRTILLDNGYWEGDLLHMVNGKELVIRSRQIVDKDANGLPTSILEINRDITKETQIEKEMERLARLDLVGQMAASIGHEIRNPMTVVRGYLQRLTMRDEFKNHSDEFSLLISELDRANEIITEYLSLAKNKITYRSQITLQHVLANIRPLIETEAVQKGITLHWEIIDTAPLWIDENEVRQLILNLYNNGLEASPKNGTITLRTYTLHDYAVLEIEDQGAGIPPTIVEKIGTPFVTSKPNGTGLGLPVCYSIAARNNAKIDFTTSNSGTTFKVLFSPLSS